MSFGLRDKSRYGKFKAESNKGIVTVEITICGFGEQISVYQDGKLLESVNTLDADDEDGECYYDEDDKKITVENITIQKPFLRTLKRYR